MRDKTDFIFCSIVLLNRWILSYNIHFNLHTHAMFNDVYNFSYAAMIQAKMESAISWNYPNKGFGGG